MSDNDNSNNRYSFERGTSLLSSTHRNVPLHSDGNYSAGSVRSPNVQRTSLLGKSAFPMWATVILCLLGSAGLAILAFAWCQYVLEFSWIISLSLALAFFVIAAACLVISKPFRATLSVSAASLGLAEGQSMLLGMGFALILAGPVTNVLQNAEILIHSTSCLKQILKNESQVRCLSIVLEMITG